MPVVSNQKKVYVFPIQRTSVHHMYDMNMFRRELDTRFFLNLTDQCIRYFFFTVEVTGRETVISVLPTGIEPAQK